MPRSAAPIIAFLLTILGGCATPNQSPPDVRYTVEHGEGAWRIRVAARGLGAVPGPIQVRLEDWGEWTALDSYYLRSMRSTPPLQPSADDPARWEFVPPAGWDGSIDVSYEILLAEFSSRAHQGHGLLPWWVDGYSLGFANNTLVRILADGEPIEACTVELRGARWGVTGWDGAGALPRRIRPPRGIDKTPIVFGEPHATAHGRRGGIEFEVAQMAGGADATGPMLALVGDLVLAYGRSTGRSHDGPFRVFIVDQGGGQKTDHGLLVQHRAPHDGTFGPDYSKLVAHEAFHEWLGGYARSRDESLVWFQEGFTDYLALWHLVSLGVIGPEWFADHLTLLDSIARASEAYGKVTFADPGVRWRDWDGPNETLAYKGGAMLAFFVDADLRRAGGPGLPALIGELASVGEFGLGDIRRCLGSRGLAETCEQRIDAPFTLPDLAPALEAIGFARTRRTPAQLTYTGITSDGDSYLGTVIAVDPDGPAALCGLRVGDTITGLWPAREDRPEIGPECTTGHRFGLNLCAPGAEEINIGFVREGRETQARLRPRPIPGGAFVSWRADRSRTDAFFRP